MSIFYVAYADLPQVNALLYGIQPVVVAIVVLAVCKLGLTSARRPAMLALDAVALAATPFAGHLGWGSGELVAGRPGLLDA